MDRLKYNMEEELHGFNGRVGLAIEIEGESFYFNSEKIFPSASVIKIPILIEGLRQSEIGKINLEELISIPNRAGGSGVLQILSSNVMMTVKDLMSLMIIVSDNTATNLLIDLLGIEAINDSMKNMGLQDTVLSRQMMDFVAIEHGLDNYTSPRDMISCLKVVNEGTYLSKASRKIALEIMKYQQFQDKLPGMIDLDRIFVANKTGSLPRVEHDCAVFKYKGKTAYAAVLLDHLDDIFAGKQKISRIGKHIYNYLLEESR
jgi:beta-lactamase class A